MTRRSAIRRWLGRRAATVATGTLLTALAAADPAPPPAAPAQPPGVASAQDAPSAPSAPSAARPEAAACPAPPVPLGEPERAQALAAGVNRGFLWRLGRDGRSTWLYGTLHAARREWAAPGPAVHAALQAADALALELDLADPAVARRLARLALAGPDTPPLPQPLRERVQAQARTLCAGPELALLRPELQAITLGLLAGRQAGYEPAFGIDGELATLARALGKPVLGLETADGQMALLLQDSAERTQAFVEHTLIELERGRSGPLLDRLARAWADSDWPTLDRYADWCECLGSEDDRVFMRRLLDTRNRAMAAEIVRHHAAGRQLFVAVGALHLAGPEGLPALLAAQGFRLEPLLPPEGR